MASSSAEQSRAKRTAALNELRFKRAPASSQPSAPPSSSSSNAPTPSYQPPPQSRDATVSSRFFPATPSSTGTILVPSSSPMNSPPNNTPNRSFQHPGSADVAGAGRRLGPSVWGYEQRSPGFDPLSSSSGFSSSSSNIRPLHSRTGGHDAHIDGPPRKRLNRGTSPESTFSADTPDSPLVQKPGQRRRNVVGSLDATSTSSEESSAGPSRRIMRRPEQIATSNSSSSQDIFQDERFKRFKICAPGESESRVRAAWIQAGQDATKATQLLVDPNWDPNPPPKPRPPITPKPKEEHGKVEGIVEASKMQRMSVKEKGKKSMIYANRLELEKSGTQATPPSSKIVDLTASPMSPIVRPRKRIMKMVLDSDEEEDGASSSQEEEESPRKRSRQENTEETEALRFFNNKAPAALQELTGMVFASSRSPRVFNARIGCTLEQANAIIGLRPFKDMEDLNARLGQGKKKAGPSGISPRMFEDATDIFRGYSVVDSVLEDCENIGAKLRSSIEKWTTHSSSKQNTGNEEEGALSLRSLAPLKDKKLKGYLVQQPASIASGVQLKDYQLLGVNWLHLLYSSSYSCILADEMGLGKTIQVISFFAYLKEKGNKGPHLVVVPSSTLENWCREFARFAPAVSVQTYYAGKEERVQLRQTLLDSIGQKRDDGKGWDVLITTYNLAQSDGDRKFFRRIEWDSCVFDEGHVLKNFQSQRYKSLLRVESKWRLLLTGTPLQNNLQELVSLMNFILPDQFADAIDDLRAIFKVKGDSKVSLLAQERVSRAKKMMTPFVLRRRKDQVLGDLPKKTERIEWCETTQLQRSIYKETLQRSRKTILDTTSSADSTDSGVPNGKGKPAKKRANPKGKDKQYVENSSNVLMDLRKAALHPMLFRSRFTDDILTAIAKQLLKEPDFKKRGALFDIVKEDMTVMTDAELQHYCGLYKSTRKYLQPADCFLDSGKVQALLKLLKMYQDEGRKVLIFSQFTQVLDILELILKERHIKYLVLTGSTPVDVRQSLVDEFTEDESISAFLLSTKAGGMGINLTAASVVIMFDQDFNPHNDRQAQDRAYRIGQKRDVDVVKLITRGTIEEDMLKLGEMKLALDEAVAGDDEKDDSAPERAVKTSLMKTLRQQLIDEEGPSDPMEQ
ncbi:DNA-dependent ATPase fun30 [Paramarasmius palmivorus]|uniref:DNA helicase n=1 Tax=Paramarasmius palmivorus TaxID=297713 RepID=A0AAW0DQM5_9AGAR